MTPHEVFSARRYAWVGASLFAIAAVFACVQLGMVASSHGFSVLTAAELGLAAVWAVAAVAMGGQIGPLAPLPVMGAWLAVIYGCVMGMSTLWIGLPFIVGGVLVAYLGAKSAPLFRSPPQHVTNDL